MSTIKFKNGSSWVELSLGGSGQDLFPVGSIYVTQYNEAQYATQLSPASIIGGSWTRYEDQKNSGNSTMLPRIFTSGVISGYGAASQYRYISAASSTSGNAYYATGINIYYRTQ